MTIPADRDFRILQLTDLHLGFGPLSIRADRLAMQAVRKIIRRAEPDLIILTGDFIFPFLPKTGTMNNRRQARRLLSFLDQVQIPYTFTLGNHDCEIGAPCRREEMAGLLNQGSYSFFARGPRDIFGVGNFFLKLTDFKGRLIMPLVLLDSNMYGGGWFYSGFDSIHDDQTAWCMNRLAKMQEEDPSLAAMAFFHIPPKEFKEAYAKMKSGDRSVTYCHGGIGEREDYFGISNRPGQFFSEAVRNRTIKWMFCGHDHLNNLSLIYQGIRLTYGMSVDYLAYRGIRKKKIQRGGTRITIHPDRSVDVEMIPLHAIVTPMVRGGNYCGGV